jgi:hypothetical protein
MGDATRSLEGLRVPKAIWVAVAALVLGVVAVGAKELQCVSTTYLLKEALCLGGNSLFSAALLLLMLQLPVIRAEVEAYFISAFSSSSFVRNFRPRELTALVRRFLHARYAPTADETYVDAVVSLMDSFAQPYVSRHVEHVHVRIAGERVTKHINKSCDICARHAASDDIVLLSLLKRRILSTRVLFETKSDTRKFTALKIRVGAATVLELTAADFHGLPPDFLKAEPLSGPQYEYASVADWNVLAKKFPALTKTRVPKNESVTIISSEWRETGLEGLLFSHRFYSLTHAPKLQVVVDPCGSPLTIRAFMYGNGLQSSDVSVINNPNSLSLETDRWLFPGCGFTVSVERPRTDTGKKE